MKTPLVLALVFALCAPSPHIRAEEGKPLSFGLSLAGLPLTRDRIDAAARETGLPVRLVNFYLQWPSNPAQGYVPLDTLQAVDDAGALPCVTWEPMHYETGNEVMIAAETILSGGYDRYIDDFAAAVREWGKPLLIRFGHEMNLARYHWGSAAENFGPKSPEQYAQMFRHVRKRFRAAGADNAAFVFCPNAESVPNPSHDPEAAWNTVSAYWPGEEYVDVLGMDGYNWGLSRTPEKDGWQSSFQSFAEIFGSVREELSALAPSLPLAVFETASVDLGGDKGRWIEDAFTTAGEWRLHGLVWFQENKELDWRIQSGSGTTWRDAVAPLVDGAMPAWLTKEE